MPRHMNMKTTLMTATVIVALTAAGCGSTGPAATGGDVRYASATVPLAAEPVPKLGPVDAAVPANPTDDLVFKPAPVPVPPPAPKPVRSLPTPPPDRAANGAPVAVPDEAPVADAIADLAGRLSVAPDTIEVLDARFVTWRDGAVGCPEEGLAYSQALVPGWLVVLRVDDASYRYHSAEGAAPFFCATPQSPLEGSA